MSGEGNEAGAAYHKHRGFAGGGGRWALTEYLDFTDRGRHEAESPTESPTEAGHRLTDRMQTH